MKGAGMFGSHTAARRASQLCVAAFAALGIAACGGSSGWSSSQVNNAVSYAEKQIGQEVHGSGSAYKAALHNAAACTVNTVKGANVSYTSFIHNKAPQSAANKVVKSCKSQLTALAKSLR